MSHSNDFIQCSGVVAETGLKVATFKEGDEVIVLRSNNLSSSIVTCEKNLIPKPASLSWEEASCFGLIHATVHHTLVDMAGINEGDTIFINQPESSLGQAFIQIARALGAKVICAGEVSEFVTKYGIMTVVDSNSTTLIRDILHQTDGKGLDLFIETTGSPVSHDLMSCMAEDGKACMVTVNNARNMSAFLTPDNIETIVVDAIDLSIRNKEALQYSMGAITKLLKKQPEFGLKQEKAGLSDINLVSSCNDVQTISIPDGYIPDKANYGSVVLEDDATYMVVCGSTFYQSLAKWLVGNGAKNLILVGEDAMFPKTHDLFMSELKLQDVSLTDMRVNLLRDGELTKKLKKVTSQGMPNLKGVFYAGALTTTFQPEQIELEILRMNNLYNELNVLRDTLGYFVLISGMGEGKSQYTSSIGLAYDSLVTHMDIKNCITLSFHMGDVLGMESCSEKAVVAADIYLRSMEIALQMSVQTAIIYALMVSVLSAISFE